LATGRVGIDGCEVSYFALPVEEMFIRAFDHEEFDVVELSLSTYAMLTSRGLCAYRAIPVFPLRMFRHSAIYVHAQAGIDKPADLRGRVIGVPEYQVTAAVWVRGLLEDEHGVHPRDIRWRTGGIEDAGRREKSGFTPPADVEIESIPPSETLTEHFLAREIDALIAPREPRLHADRHPSIRRLFPDARPVEMEYYDRTKIFPIMHVLAIRRTLADTFPWLAVNVYKAFVESRRICMERLSDETSIQVMIPWVMAARADAMRHMGADFWPYGTSENRATLNAFVRYHAAQGLSRSPLSDEDLFVPSTLEQYRT
jgi:4,5-dihydroxyphthalate decarboxylase